MLDPRNIYRSKRKTLAIFVDPNGVLIAKAPLKLPEHKIFEFVKTKENWIRNAQRKIAENSYINHSVVRYNSFMLMGKELMPVIHHKAKKISHSGEVLVIPSSIQPEKILRRVEKYLREQAHIVLNERAQYFANSLKMEASSIGVNNNKTRWGSCDTKRRINLNWRSVMLPPNLFDYIVVHEFCHLLEFNHTKQFWAIVETILPDWRVLRKHLKQMNWILSLFRK